MAVLRCYGVQSSGVQIAGIVRGADRRDEPSRHAPPTPSRRKPIGRLGTGRRLM
jgi:hypothetical protein